MLPLCTKRVKPFKMFNFIILIYNKMSFAPISGNANFTQIHPAGPDALSSGSGEGQEGIITLVGYATPVLLLIGF